MNKAFTTEEEMVSTFIKNPIQDIESQYAEWNRWAEREVRGLFGIPDVLIAYGKVGPFGQKCVRTYAFELKLRNWQRALVQAYKYSSFANYSWVILDQAHIKPALANIAAFQRANIGLLSIDITGAITYHHQPKFQTPYSPNLYNSLLGNLDKRLFHHYL